MRVQSSAFWSPKKGRRLHTHRVGVGTVTGSKTLVETEEGLVLVGCGLFQVPREIRERNWQPFPMALDRGDAQIIITASGMGTSGRVVHHLKALLPDKDNTVVLVGYQAVGTLRRMLAEGAEKVKIHGRYVRVCAEIDIVAAVPTPGERMAV